MLNRLLSALSTFQRRLAHVDSVPQFALLGIASGALTGLVIILFRKVVEVPLLLLTGGPENFEGLDHIQRFTLPIAGAIALAILFSFLKLEDRRVGVVHLIERLGRFHGHLPLRNAIVQFVAGTLALLSGQSLGREGPAIHLGAAGSSLLGQALHLPNNSIRVLVGCGAAAAISASFNTPIAGVIFSMEVILMEYTFAGFIPVILAAVTAAVISQIACGNVAAFDVPVVAMHSLLDVPFLIVLGIAIGLLAVAFGRLVEWVTRHAPAAIWQRMLIAGTTTAVIGLAVPEVLGVGYDTVNLALVGELSVYILAAACLAKLLASATGVGMGMPAGLIGPTLFTGATAGGLIGTIGITLAPQLASSMSLYVMLGMGAMMGAVLQAPLAALMAIVELTHSPIVILPAMLVIVTACITANQFSGSASIFIQQMTWLGIEFRQNPISMVLNRASMESIMSRSFARTPQSITRAEADKLLTDHPVWLLVQVGDRPGFIMRTEDLANHLADKSSGAAEDDPIDLANIPATRKDVAPILRQATLMEAMERLDSTGMQALYINRISAPMLGSVVGIATREDIESFYQT